MPNVPVKITKKYDPTKLKAQRVVPEDTHEWVSFEDPDEHRMWVFDATFLLSAWTCIFGRGCQGVLRDPASELVQGCCSYGAHFSDKADADRVAYYAKTLKPEEWQFYEQGQSGVLRTMASGEITTKLVKGACIFANRPNFSEGAGCALHLAALKRGKSYIDMKPEVCWQLPLHREDETRDDGYVVTTITQWERGHWGTGGHDFHWWCTEEPSAFVGKEPVYQAMRDELVAMVGPKTYARLDAYLSKKRKDKTMLPHPVEAHGQQKKEAPHG